MSGCGSAALRPPSGNHAPLARHRAVGQNKGGGTLVPETAAEVLFYHLERQPLERVLPTLLEKTLARGWTAVVQSGSEERLQALDTALWTYSEESFLPHGTKKDRHPAMQPIYLTLGDYAPIW